MLLKLEAFTERKIKSTESNILNLAFPSSFSVANTYGILKERKCVTRENCENKKKQRIMLLFISKGIKTGLKNFDLENDLGIELLLK